MRIKPFVLVALLAGCADVPALPGDGTDADRNAPYPALVPLGPILAAAAVPGTGDPSAGIGARVAALNARADALRGPVLDPATASALQ